MERTRLVVLFAAAALAGSLAAPASLSAAASHTASKCNDTLPLHLGSCGPKVAELQYLLRNPRPKQNVFAKVKGTFKGQPNGLYGKGTAAALTAYRYRIGVPGAGQCGSKTALFKQAQVTGYFFNLLRGRANRKLCWVALAQVRLQLVEAGATAIALKIKAYEFSQLGVRETCGGSCNRGPTVDKYQRYFGLLGQPWCAIFQAYSWTQAGAPLFAPPPYNRFFVPSIGQWALRNGYLNAKAKVGSLVAFLSGPNVLDGTHIGYVVKLVGGSGYMTVEGNSSDAVREVYHPWNDRLRVFIDVPTVA